MAANNPNNPPNDVPSLEASALRFQYGESIDYAALVANLDDPEIYGTTTGEPDVQAYLHEVNGVPQIMTAEAAEELHERALEPTTHGLAARRQLLLGHLGMVVQIAVRYVKPDGPSLLELIDEGNFALLQLVTKLPDMEHTFFDLAKSELGSAMNAAQKEQNLADAGFWIGSLAGKGHASPDNMAMVGNAGASGTSTTFEYLMGLSWEEQARLIQRASRETLSHEEHLIFGMYYGVSGFQRKSAAELAHTRQMSNAYMHGIIDDISGKVRIALERMVAVQRVAAFLNSRTELS